jgi:hypothetical protein
VQEFNDYKLLRVTEDMDDDADFASSQTMPAAADMVELRRPGALRGDEPVRLKVEIVLEWLDSGGDLVTTDRGSYDVQVIHVTTRRGPLSGSVIVDSVVLRGQTAHRPVVLDDVLVGDAFTVRLTNMVREGAFQARVLYREII